MANVLSQEEIDALLGGMSGGTIDTAGDDGIAEDVAEDEATPFDFTDQDRFLRGRLPTLETIHDRFARLLRMSLSTSLRRPVDIQICSQTVCSFGDFSRSLEKPHSLHVIRMDPLKGSGLLVLPARLILTLVDLMFGGNGQPVAISEERDFTLIEQVVIQKIAEDIRKSYAESWQSVYPLHLEEAGTETNLQFINIAQAQDAVDVVDCDVTIESNRTSLSICIPYATLEPIKDILKGAFTIKNADVDQSQARRVNRTIQEASVEVRAMLGTATITGRDLLAMKEGDILQLNEDFEHPVEILVQGLRKFWGVIGTHKSTRALQITGIEEPQRGDER